MAIAIGAQGASATGTTSMDVPYPASISAGELLACAIVTKYHPNGPATPAGWELSANGGGGAGASGVDSGTVDGRWIYKIADGTETGNLTITNASANAMIGRMVRLTKAASKNWGVASGIGSQNSATTSWSVATTLTDILLGDFVFAMAGVNGNTTSYSAEAITGTGLTLSSETERTDQASAQGDDLHLVTSNHIVSGSMTSGAATFSMTAAGSTGNTPAGVVVLLRLRELDAFTIDPNGIATAESVPSPHVAHTVGASSASSAEAFGPPVMQQFVAPSSIATAESFGTPDAVLILGPSGIASLEAFGTPVFELLLAPTSIASAESVPQPDVVLVLEPTSIPTAEAFGSPTLDHVIGAVSIASLEAFGPPTMALILDASSIASLESVPSPDVVMVLSPASIASAESFGATEIEAELVLFPVSIASLEAFGIPSLLAGIVLPETPYVAEYQRLFSARADFQRLQSSRADFQRNASFIAEVD